MVQKSCVEGCRTNLKSELKKDPSNRKSCFTFPSKERDPKRRAVWMKNVRRKEICSSQKKQLFGSFILIINLLEVWMSSSSIKKKKVVENNTIPAYFLKDFYPSL